MRATGRGGLVRHQEGVTASLLNPKYCDADGKELAGSGVKWWWW